MMLFLQNISYTHPNRDILFSNLNMVVNSLDKFALIGNNGSGKSTLLKIIAGQLKISEGQLKTDGTIYYVPQTFGQYNHLTIAQALGIEVKLNALTAILGGDVSELNMSNLNEDWTIEERCIEALQQWGLQDIELTQTMASLSGGQKTKVFLAGIAIHQPNLVLMDEPSNHLDAAGRTMLYELIQSTNCTLLVVSHDRKLLNLLGTVGELANNKITTYGGNYDFYQTQKQIEQAALQQDIHNKEKALRKARDKERESVERQQKLDARGKNKQEKAGIARIMMNTLRNSAENSTSKIKGVHADKIKGLSRDLNDLRAGVPEIDKMKLDFDDSSLHKGKILFEAKDINVEYHQQALWKTGLSFQIASGERILLRGLNGSGKTTVIKIITGALEPTSGQVFRTTNNVLYIDQDYSLLQQPLSVYEQCQQFNHSALQEHEIKIRLTRFLFNKEDWDKPSSALSGGERMRLLLCCLTISSQAPDIIMLDEPTNNLDIQNIEILTAAISDYKGTLLMVSHDEQFLEDISVERVIALSRE